MQTWLVLVLASPLKKPWRLRIIDKMDVAVTLEVETPFPSVVHLVEGE